MASFRLRYVVEDRDRHGNVRIYLRRPGKPKIRLQGIPGSERFMEHYKKAVAGELGPAVIRRGKRAPVAAGSLRAVCMDYYGSGEFKRLDTGTQRVRRSILDGLCEKHGHKPFKMMQPRHVFELRDERAEAPQAANARVKALRQVFKFAVLRQLAHRNMAADVPYLDGGVDGFHSWTLDEVQRFEKKYPVGTRA